MIFGIDATNIKAGGGLTHLKNIVEFFKQDEHEIILFGGSWLGKINNRPWIIKQTNSEDFTSFIKQELFKIIKLPKLLSKTDIAFIPGGTFFSKKIKYVSMSQNMLVFEEKERNRFPKSLNWLRYILLEKLQVRSFKSAKGIIYISNYAKDYIENKYPELKNKKSTVVYHGISDDFRQIPKQQNSIDIYSKENPFIISYISIVNFYKHQWNVIEAVKKIYTEGFSIQLDLIGPMYLPAKERFDKALEGNDEFIRYKGVVPYEEIAVSYKKSDLFIYASTCENMPNILVEAMSAGLPILSSSYGPMPEVLKDGGIYMDPTDVNSIYENLRKMLNDPRLRTEKAEKAYQHSLAFSWEKTAKETFEFLKNVYLES